MALNVTVTIKDRDPVEVEITNPDRVRWDLTSTRHKWPSFQDAPFLGMTFLAWAAMKRTGLYSGPWEEFRDSDCVMVEDTSDSAAEEEIEGVGNLPAPGLA